MIKEEHRNLLKVDFLILGIILVIALTFRVYKYNTPLADFHSWRQADTAAVAKNFVKGGFDLLHPKYDDLSNIQSGKENPEGYRFVEFPLYNALIAVGYSIFPFVALEIWGRFISIISSLVVLAIMYYFLVKEHSRTAAIIGSTVFATFPFFVFFSRVVLPEMNALAFMFLSLFFSYRFALNSKKLSLVTFSFAVLFFAAAVLIKPTVIFYGLPILYLFIKKYSLKFYKKPFFYLFFILSLIPLILWRKYILNFPQGIPSSSWLITSVNTSTGLQNIFLRPSFFRWIFYERINNLILGGYTTFLFILGLIVKSPRYFLHSIIVAAFAYIFVFEGGNVQHAYYQTLILPALGVSVGLGGAFLIENASLFISKIGVFILIFVTLVFSFLISYNQVKDYYSYSVDLVHIARYINQITAPDDKIVTDTVGDTTLLFLANRRGAPAVYKSLPELKNQGYSYFVTFSKDVATAVIKDKKFTLIEENEKFALFKL